MIPEDMEVGSNMDITPAEGIIAFIGFLGCCYVCRAMWNYATRDDVEYYYPPDNDLFWEDEEDDDERQ